MTDTTGGGWTCSACTFVNGNAHFLVCEVCLTRRSDSSAPLWHFDGDGGFQPYHAEAQAELATADGPVVVLRSLHGKYSVDMANHTQTNLASGYVRAVRCVAPDGSVVPGPWASAGRGVGGATMATPLVGGGFGVGGGFVSPPVVPPASVAYVAGASVSKTNPKGEREHKTCSRSSKKAKGLADESSSSGSGSSSSASSASAAAAPEPEVVPDNDVLRMFRTAAREAMATQGSASETSANGRSTMMEMVRRLFETIEAEPVAAVDEAETGMCSICCSDFGDAVAPLRTSACGHCVLCSDCFRAYVVHRVDDGDVMPWKAEQRWRMMSCVLRHSGDDVML